MNKKEWFEAISELAASKSLYLNPDYQTGDEWGFSVKGSILSVKLAKEDNGSSYKKVFTQVMNLLEGKVYQQVTINELSNRDSLELLFHHYPYGLDDNSNCAVVNEANELIGVNRNGLDSFTIINSHCICLGGFAINNKKWCKGVYKIEDLEKLKPVFEALFPNNK